MNKEKLTYIEESGITFEQMGMTRMAGRLFGYLIVSDMDAVSFNDIKEALDASKGSISGTTKQLITMGLIEPITLPGDRKTYFRISKAQVGTILKERIYLFNKLSSLLDKGNSLKENKDETAEWLKEMSAFYSWIVGSFDEILNRWEAEKLEIIKRKEKKDGNNKKQKKYTV
ncbi:MAG: helix-turn-helix domain-containing protein [Balneolaceae bacterium]